MRIYKVAQNLQYLQSIGVPDQTAVPILEYLLSIEGDDRKAAVRQIRKNPNISLEELKGLKRGKENYLEQQNTPPQVIETAKEFGGEKYSIWVAREIMKWYKSIDKWNKQNIWLKQKANDAQTPNEIDKWTEELLKHSPIADPVSGLRFDRLSKELAISQKAEMPYIIHTNHMTSDARWREIMDWAEQNEPNIMAFSFVDAEHASGQWHEELAQQEVDRSITYATHNVVYTFQDGWVIVKLAGADCEAEGNRMGHCVGGYEDEVESGDTEIYSLRDNKNEPHVTLEMKMNQRDSDYGYDYDKAKNGYKIQIEQIQGKGNDEPIPEYKERIKEWFTSLKSQGMSFEPVEIDLHPMEAEIDVSNFMDYANSTDEYGLEYDLGGEFGGNHYNYTSNLESAYELGTTTRGEYYDAEPVKAIDNLIQYAIQKEEIDAFDEATYEFGEFAEKQYDETVGQWIDPDAPPYPSEPTKQEFMETYEPSPEQNEFEGAGFEDVNQEVFNEEAYNNAYAKYEEELETYDEYEQELRENFSATRIYNYLVKEWNQAKAEYQKKKQLPVAAKSNKMIKTAEKKIPEAEELAAYVEAMNLFLKKGKIKNTTIAKVVENLPYPDSIRMNFSEQECKLVFESIAYAWKKLTKQNLLEEAKIDRAPKGLDGNFWMVTGGVILEGPNHFTIIKQNLNLFATLLNISPFVLHEKLASPPEELIDTVVKHGGMRVFINKDRQGYFQMTDDTYSKWGRKKVKKLDLKSKNVKVIDKTRPYKGWKTGVPIQL